MKTTLASLASGFLLVSCSTEQSESTGYQEVWVWTRDFAELAGLSIPRTHIHPADERLNFWILGAGEEEWAVGFCLQNLGGQSRAFHVDIEDDRTNVSKRAMTPRSGWNSFWNQLHALQAFAIPDAASIPEIAPSIHGVWVQAEYVCQGRYGHYTYSNPAPPKHPREKQVMSVVSLLSKEFVLKKPFADTD